MIERKSFDVDPASLDTSGEPGEFEAVVAVFGNVDQGGDRMVKGAFARTLKEAGMPPVVWSHEWQTPPIGHITQAEETDEGLHVKGRLFVAADEDHAIARQVYAAMKAGALREFSFGYQAREHRQVETEDGKSVRELVDVDLFEVGPTLKGMNPATRLVGVKHALDEMKAGRVLSTANERKLQQAAVLIGDVLSTAQLNPDDTTATATSESASAPKNFTPEQHDNPCPNTTQQSGAVEEGKARIAELLNAAPRHTPTILKENQA